MTIKSLPVLIAFIILLLAPTSALAAGATFSLTPAIKSVSTGQIFQVTINLNSGDTPVTGASAIILYEPSKLSVVASDGTLASQIATGAGAFASPTVTTNFVDSTNGQIRLDQTTTTPFSGQGSYGTFYLKPLTAGSTTLAFSFSQGSTTGSIVSSGTPPTNVLSSVSGATYTISASSGSATPAPLPASGVDSPTYLLFIAGLSVLGIGFFSLKSVNFPPK